MNNLVSRIKAAQASRVNREENADIVQTIIIIGIFVVICIVAGAMITSAISSQASQVSNCISDARGAAHGNGQCANYR
jgi:flagellar basal body-associated protein FliL